MSGGNFIEGWTPEEEIEVLFDILLFFGCGYSEKEAEEKKSYFSEINDYGNIISIQ